MPVSMLQRIGQGFSQAVGSLVRRGAGPSDPDEPRFAEDFVTMVDKEFERRRQERTGLELQWRLNGAFAAGDQFHDINTTTQTLEETPPLSGQEEREVFNQIAPILEVRHARLTRGRTIRKVRPASNQQQDIQAAEISGKVIRVTEQDHRERAQFEEGAAWGELTGGWFKKNIWDPRKGRVVAMEVSPEGGDPRPVREGDLSSRVVPYYEIYPRNLWASFEDNPDLIHARAYPVKEIRERWGVEVQEEAVDAISLQPAKGGRGLEYASGQYTLRVTKLKGHALVKEWWERPCESYPEGRLIIVAGKHLLYQGPLPFQVGKDYELDLPFTHYACIKTPGQFFATCLMPRLIPVQRRYNSLRNRKAEYLKRAAIGQPVYEENSLANEDEILESATEAGQQWVVKQGRQHPHYMEFPPLPNDFNTEMQDLLTEFRSLSGVSDLSKMGDAPPGVKSGVALSIALEQDETRLSSTAGNYEEAKVEEAKHWLRLYRQFALIPRIGRIADASEVEVLEWSAADISSDDVILEAGSGLGESPAQRRAFMYDLAETGVLFDPATGKWTRESRRAFLEALEMGHWESATDTDYELQISAAKRNIAAIKAGRLPVVQPFYDFLVHLQELHRWMLSQEFEEMAAADLNVQAAAYMYRQQLIATLEQQMLAQMAMQQAGQGPGAQDGQPGSGEQRQPQGSNQPQMDAAMQRREQYIQQPVA